MAKRLVTPRFLTKGGDPWIEALRSAGHVLVACRPGEVPDEEELLRLLPECSGHLAGVEKISARVLKAASGVKVIGRDATGIDNIDLAARQLGIAVHAAHGANARRGAELTEGLILGLVRTISYSVGALKAEQWKRRKGIEALGRNLGLIG